MSQMEVLSLPVELLEEEIVPFTSLTTLLSFASTSKRFNGLLAEEAIFVGLIGRTDYFSLQQEVIRWAKSNIAFGTLVKVWEHLLPLIDLRTAAYVYLSLLRNLERSGEKDDSSSSAIKEQSLKHYSLRKPRKDVYMSYYADYFAFTLQRFRSLQLLIDALKRLQPMETVRPLLGIYRLEALSEYFRDLVAVLLPITTWRRFIIITTRKRPNRSIAISMWPLESKDVSNSSAQEPEPPYYDSADVTTGRERIWKELLATIVQRGSRRC